MRQLVTELVERIRVYPKFRYHSLLLKTAHTTYTAIRGRLADQLRELGFSRGRLGELLRVFEDARDAFPNLASDPYALLPVGSRSLPDAVEQLAAGMSAVELADLDARMQNLVQLQFRGFNHLCNSGSSTMRSLGQAMLEESLSYAAAPKLQGQDVVSMFLGQHGEGDEGAAAWPAPTTRPLRRGRRSAWSARQNSACWPPRPVRTSRPSGSWRTAPSRTCNCSLPPARTIWCFTARSRA